MTDQKPERITRITVPALDEILGLPFPVLDDGFVRVVDYMGDESSIVQAARVSYGKGTKKVHEDRGLLRYLMRANHGTPFEMCSIKLHLRVPMDAWRQWIRHRTFSVNEYSTRYSEAIDSAQTTETGEWRLQGKGNRQGSEGFVMAWPDNSPAKEGAGPDETPGEYLTYRESWLQRMAREVYEERLTFGVAREQARKDLPLSTYTEAYWCGNLRNLLHFLGLRMDSHAQKEIRDYADIIGEQIVAKWLPNVWDAFNDYHPLRDAMMLTRQEVDTLRQMIIDSQDVCFDAEEPNTHFAQRVHLPEEWRKESKKTPGKLKRNRERDEFIEKLRRLGVDPDF